MAQNIPSMPQNQALYIKNQYGQQQPPNFSAAGTQISSGGKVVENNPILSRAEKAKDGGDNPLILPVGTAAFGAAMIALTNFMNKPLQEKTYENTFYHRVEEAVDRFATKPNAAKFFDYLKDKKTWLSEKLNKSEIYRTLRTKPSKGGPQVQSQAAGSRGHLAGRALEVMRKYKEANPGFTGFDSILNKASKDSYKYYDEIIKTIETSGIDKAKIFAKRPWWGLGLINNKTNLQEILNKSKLIENYKAGGKSVGQKAAGYLMRGTECLTNGMFSGKGAILFQAFFIAQSLQEAMKAEKGEKVSTFMGSFAELMAMMATIGVQMRIMNSLAGLKFIGMETSEHKAYQKYMELAQKYAKEGNTAMYKKALANIKNLKKAANANTKWYQKPIKWLGNVCAFGRLNETVKPLKTGNAFTNFFKKIPYGTKVGLGYAGRVALVMAVVMPLFSKPAKKIAYAIFGTPKKTLEKEKMNEKEGEQPENAQTPQAQQPQTAVNPNQQIVKPQQPQQQLNPQQQAPFKPAQPGNLLQKMQQQQQNPIGAQGISTAPIASSELKTPEYNAGIKRTYIPNPVLGYEAPANPASSRAAEIDAVMRQADFAEAQAQKYMNI